VSFLVLGAFLLLLGALLAWANATLFDSEGFANAASDSLQNEAVQDRLATRLTDRIVADDPERARLRPLIEGASSAIIDSSQFEALFREAVERLHTRVFDEDRNDLILDLTEATARILELIERTAPELAARIPPEVESGVITISESDFRTRLIRLADGVSFLAFALPVLSVVAFAGSVYFARNRNAAAFRLGMTLSGLAAVVLLALMLGGAVVGETVRDPANSSAAEGIWWAFMDSLRVTMRLVALLGAALAVGAWWVAHRGWPRGLATPDSGRDAAHARVPRRQT